MPRGSNPQAGKPEQATSCQSGRAPSCSGEDPPGRVGRMRTGLHLPTVRLVHELVVPCSPQATEVKEQTVSITRECRQDYIGAPRVRIPSRETGAGYVLPLWSRIFPAGPVRAFRPGAACKASSHPDGFPGKPVNCSAAKEDQHDEPELQHRSRRRRAGENVDQGVPVEDDAKRQLANAARLPIVFKHRGHAGRAPGHRRDRRLGDPDPQGHHSGGGGRGHRLRHDGGQDHAARRGSARHLVRCARPSSRPCRTARRRAAVATRAAGRTRRCPWTRSGPRWPTSSTRCASCIRACATPTTASTWARWARATTSSRSAWMRRVSSGSCCTRSRGVGNAIGTHFIELAKKDAQRHQSNLPDENLAYFEEGAQYFGHYVRAVSWAQKFALQPRGDDGQPDRDRAQGHRQALRVARGGGELPPQLCSASATSARTCS